MNSMTSVVKCLSQLFRTPLHQNLPCFVPKKQPSTAENLIL